MLPFAVLSLLTHRSLRSTLLAARRLHLRAPARELRWVPGSRPAERSPFGFFLPYMVGPRWNCHALTASFGPFSLREAFAVDTSALASVASWTLTVHDAQFRCVHTLSGQSTSQPLVRLPAGTYSLFLRVYSEADSLTTPPLLIDGGMQVPSQSFADESAKLRAFLAQIRAKDARAYRALQYHAFYALRRERWLPRRWVRSLFLPGGNPHTLFIYGRLRRGERLAFHARPAVLRDGLLYACLYNESSFPVYWRELKESRGELGPIEHDGAYLVRVVPRTGRTLSDLEPKRDLTFVRERGAA